MGSGGVDGWMDEWMGGWVEMGGDGMGWEGTKRVKSRGERRDNANIPNTIFPVPSRLVPFPPTRDAVGPAGTLLRGALGAGEEFRQDVIAGEGRQLRGSCHPAGQICFKGRLVVVTCGDGLASDFDHNIAAAVLLREEDVGAVENAADAGGPEWGAVRVVVHVCCAHEEGAGVVGPLDERRIRAVGVRVGAVVDGPCGGHELGGGPPVPGLFGPVGVGLVAGVAG